MAHCLRYGFGIIFQIIRGSERDFYRLESSPLYAIFFVYAYVGGFAGLNDARL
jgi:hypothetical protein